MLPPEELIEWLLALVPWMSASLGIPARRGRIVLPLDEEFPVDTSLEGVELAEDFFFANACHDAQAFESGGKMGFSVQRLGELGPIEAAYALALRARLVGAEPGEIVPHLRENPRAFFRAALRDLDGRDLAALDIPAAGAYRS